LEVILAGGRQIAYEWIVPGIVYFDLETQRSFGDVGGSAHKDKMGMSVGVTYSTETVSIIYLMKRMWPTW
jgi:hypothetical protein